MKLRNLLRGLPQNITHVINPGENYYAWICFNSASSASSVHHLRISVVLFLLINIIVSVTVIYVVVVVVFIVIVIVVIVIVTVVIVTT